MGATDITTGNLFSPKKECGLVGRKGQGTFGSCTRNWIRKHDTTQHGIAQQAQVFWIDGWIEWTCGLMMAVL